MLSSQGRVPVGPQAIVDWPEMARTTPAGGEVAQMGVLAVWGVAKQTLRSMPESTDAQPGPGSSVSPRCPGLDLLGRQPGRVQPRLDIAAGWGSVKCRANTCAGEARKPRPLRLALSEPGKPNSARHCGNAGPRPTQQGDCCRAESGDMPWATVYKVASGVLRCSPCTGES